MVSSTLRPHFTPGKTRYPFYRRLGGPQGRSGRAENLVSTGIRSRTVQPVVSRYTKELPGPHIYICIYIYIYIKVKDKAFPLQACTGPEGSRKLRFPDFVTTAQDGGRLLALRTGRLYPQEILLVLISVKSLSRPQGHSANERILCQ